MVILWIKLSSALLVKITKIK